ncbi:hypothetical protein [Colwellia sp. 12G3]|uniref:hypothetical protein n=1 Tax=Colwellia sp. 12G3 TaxID=2058299 RepID=UPI000C34251D|nr:hypothetical protein [Colwellia sp. 12G3]PKI13991.1 hypothetical protein CXF71_15505 [Colwellia sp. 12G3]
MDSRYPVIELWLSNQPHSESDSTENNRRQYLNKQYINTAVEKLVQSDFSREVLIYRPHFNAEIRELSVSEYHWLTLINQGISLGKALDIMSKTNKLAQEFT